MSSHRPAPDSRDAFWLSGLRTGRFDTFKDLFDTFAERLWRFARQSVESHIADDIIQDVMFDLWRRRAEVHVEHGFAQYLFGAVRNRVVKHLRHQHVADRADANSLPVPSPSPSVDASTLGAEIDTAMARAMTHLTELQRAVITLRWEEEMTYDQIAATLLISPQAARQHGSRALKILRPLLAPYV